LLTEAIKAARGKSKKKISWKQTVLLSEKEFELLTIDSDIAKKLNTYFKSDYLNSVKNITDHRNKFKKDRELINGSLEYLVEQDWKRAGENVSSIKVDEVSKLAAKSIFFDSEFFQKGIDLTKEKPWSYMDKTGYENLVAILGNKVISDIRVLTSDEIAELLIEGKISQHSLKINDITQLNLTWNAHTKNRLIIAGQYKAVDNEDKIWSTFSIKILAYAALEKGIEGERLLKIHLKEYNNAKEILETILEIGSKKLSLLLKEVIEEKILFKNYRGTMPQASWMSVLYSQIGTDLWINLEKKQLIKKATFEEFSLAINHNSDNTKLKSFEDEAIAALKAVKDPSYENAVGIMDWISKSPESIELISKTLSDRHINSILNLNIGDCSVIAIKHLYWRLPENYKFNFWKMLMNHVTDADDLITFGIDAAERGFKAEWNHRWNQVSGNKIKRARAHCLMARADGSRLRQVASRIDDQLMAESLFWVANNTPKISIYDRISLELSSTLGLRHWSTIRWLLSQRDPRKPPGKKFDHLYTKFEIPKKSGKPRLISSPGDGLKRLQKSVLVKLLNPIGAHESAFGFLPNKSITDNAAPHVGKRMIVNVDIQNCFPSVAWQLVLSALKRDLSTHLSDKSISFLVDICTSDGSLPIGSPASPALLNRVLLNTDKILSKQAELRSCMYTRYADDLTFSGDEKAIKLIGIAKSVLSRIGLQLDPVKTNIFRAGRRQVCTGLVVNEKVNVPRNIRRRIRAAIHALELQKTLHWDGDQMSASSLRGRIEFVRMVSPKTGDLLAERYRLASSSPASNKKSDK
jgi:RNA-directed DNA polymerase